MLNREFIDKYTQIFGDQAESFFKALEAEKHRYIRAALSRGVDYISELSMCGIEVQAEDDLPGVYLVTNGQHLLTETLGFQTGGYYIMNPSSVYAALTLCELMPEYPYILDVASAPGGKTCAIADIMKNRCAVIANEPSGKRLKSLQYNLEKYGAYSVRTISKDGRSLHKSFDRFFDGILLDAPCSNENKIFRNKTVNAEWSQDLVERMAKLQREIAVSAFETLKEGGVLVYSTCTFSIEENEGVVRHLLDSFDCELVDINKGEMTAGISGDSGIDPYVVRFLPHRDKYDGFFICAVRRKGESKGSSFSRYRPDKAVAEFFGSFPEEAEIYEKGGSFYLTTQMDRSINFSKNGIMLFKRQGELSSQAMWQLSGMMKSGRTQISRTEAVRYLKGFDIEKPHDYHGCSLYYGDIPVGTAKLVGETLKNKLDRYFLYGKNIEW
jgi:16S rRNA (cytosine1407-C5)-methyltransferase